jgi:hypothetical protein
LYTVLLHITDRPYSSDQDHGIHPNGSNPTHELVEPPIHKGTTVNLVGPFRMAGADEKYLLVDPTVSHILSKYLHLVYNIQAHTQSNKEDALSTLKPLDYLSKSHKSNVI